MYKYPVYQPSLTGNEKKYANEALDSTWISSKGEFIARFEEKFANFIGTNHAASVTNGTVAIHLALVALGLQEGDEVIVPTFTYIASVNPILQVGATPVFVDSLEGTWQMDPDDIKRKITHKTKAIIVVHLYGYPCNMNEITQIARENGLFVIEDCAEAIGSKYNGKNVGSFGDISTFSFFGNKTITCGEGGMVLTNNATLYDRVMRLKGQGLAKYREYWHDILGFNYRMTNVAAAVGLAQLEQVEIFLKKKREIAENYQIQLKDLPVVCHKEIGECVTHSYWMCSILVASDSIRDLLRDYLKENNIETRPAFYPVHTMPFYSKWFGRYPVAENLSSKGINLPSYPGLKKEDVQEICGVIMSFYKKL